MPQAINRSLRERILERDAFMCIYCGDDATGVDHIVPRSWAHNDRDDNLVACCSLCNSLASNKMFDTLQAKATYIRAARRRRHRTPDLGPSVCVMCSKEFPPRDQQGSTIFYCAECMDGLGLLNGGLND